jgi:peroxiredoxin
VRRRWLLAATAGAALALGAGVALWRETRRGAAAVESDPLFAATFEDADGVSRPLAQWRGTLLVVNFWATWCAPCVEEMPALNRVRDEYRSRGVEVIGIGIDSTDKIRAFRDRLGIGLPLLVAGAGGSELARALGNVAGVLPYTILVTPSGAIEQRRVGQIQPEQLRSWIDAQLAQRG